ncbi:MAG: YkgJ family cysteine cluster protein [Desulfobacterales bacterium]|nr:YkgJ family cysteine cluster protein [Desulfobacterales bacterium]
MNRLKNYFDLIDKVDRYCFNIQKNYGEHITCKKGCSECCVHINIFPVEAFAISVNLKKKNNAFQKYITDRAELLKNSTICPILENDECLIYEARPIICRTQGFPLLIEKDNEKKVDFCVYNFQQILSFSKDSIISLEQLNVLLSTINHYFVLQYPNFYDSSKRFTIAEALLMDWNQIYTDFTIQ